MNNEPENIRVREFEVDQNFEGWRLDFFLVDRIPRLSRTQANQIIRFGDIEALPPRALKPSTRLRLGEVIVLREHLPPETVQDHEVRILFEDQNLLLLSKPAGMLVHEAGQIRLNTVQEFLVRRGFPDAEPAHRIDRDTSGVVVCALNKETVILARKAFAKHDAIQKTYRAIARDPEGIWEPGVTRKITTPLGLDPASFLGVRMTVGDLACTTHVKPLRRGGFRGVPAVELEIRIETGRQHQIRAHLALEGTPIIGDKLYTFDDEFFAAISANPDDLERLEMIGSPRHLLHAWRVELMHPLNHSPLIVEAPLPGIWDEFEQ